jgi:predicted TIM-barrel fold metal-dependent hydrolase
MPQDVHLALKNVSKEPFMSPTLDYPIYDADTHLYETKEAFTRHLPKKYEREFQYVEVNGRTKLAIGNLISDYIPNPTFDVVAAPGAHEKWFRGQNTEGLSLRELTGKAIKSVPAYRNGDDRLKAMDQHGIHAAVVLPTLMSAIEERMQYDLEMMANVMHAGNAWILDEWGFHRQERIFAVPMIPLADLDLGIKELEWALKNGARIVGVRPAPVPGYRGSRSFGFKEFDPFWARVNEAGICVAMHASDSGYDRFSRYWQGGGEWLAFKPDPFKSCTQSLERAIHDSIAALICHGVFARHPNVRVLALENGARWCRGLFEVLNLTYGQMPQEFHEHPIETFKRHVFVGPFYEESFPALKALLGANRMLFGSDFPHPEGLAEPLDYLKECVGFTEAETKMFMSDNLKGLLEGKRD